MRHFTLATVLGLIAPALSYDVTVQRNQKYDGREVALNDFTCAFGDHGLITRGYKTLGDIPTYPKLGAAPQIMSSDLSYCGSCWQLTYFDERLGDISVVFTAIDSPGAGSEGDFVIGFDGMDYLTEGQGAEWSAVQVTATQLSDGSCSL